MESEAKFLYFKSCTVKNCKIKGKILTGDVCSAIQKPNTTTWSFRKTLQKMVKKEQGCRKTKTKLSGLDLQISNY